MQSLALGLDLDRASFPAEEDFLTAAAVKLLKPRFCGGGTAQPKPVLMASALLEAERTRTVRLRHLCLAFKKSSCDEPHSVSQAAVQVIEALHDLLERRGC